MDNDSYLPFIKISCVPFSNKSSSVSHNDKTQSEYRVEKLSRSDFKKKGSIFTNNYGLLPCNVDEFKRIMEPEELIDRPTSSGRSPTKLSDRPRSKSARSLTRIDSSRSNNTQRYRPSSSNGVNQFRSQDLDKMRANLDQITEELTVIEKRLPSTQQKFEEKEIKKNVMTAGTSTSRQMVDRETPYDATEFRDDLLSVPNYYDRLSSSLANRYDQAVMKGVDDDIDKKTLVSMIHKELEEWRASNVRTVSLQTDPKLLDDGTLQTEDTAPKNENLQAVGSSEAAVSTNMLNPSSSKGSSRLDDEVSADMDFEFPLDKFLLRNTKLSAKCEERAESTRSYEDPSANLQVIERTANLLKEVEHHWKKSIFVDNPFLSSKSISDILDSDSENYVEKLAAIRFNKSVHHSHHQADRGRPIPPSFLHTRNERLGPPGVGHQHQEGAAGDRPAHQEMHNRRPTRGMVRGGPIARGGAVLGRGGHNVRGTLLGKEGASVPRGRASPSRGSAPSIRVPPAEAKKPASAGSSQDNLKAVPKRPSSLQASPRPHISEAATNTDPVPRNNVFLDVRWTPAGPSEVTRMAVQALPSVDIRPDLRVQAGPAISIGALSTAQKRPSPANVAVFSCVHTGTRPSAEPYPRHLSREPLTSVEFDDASIAGSEEVLAAELELRSLAENVLYRVRSGRCGQELTQSLFTLVNLLSQSVNERTRFPSAPISRDLPGRMEAVSDLLSDELKTWGEQSHQHYKRIDNILKHLILDIRLSQGNEDILSVHRELGIGSGVSEGNPRKEFCKEMGEPSPRSKPASSGRASLKSSLKQSSLQKPVSFSVQSTPRLEVSLEQKLTHEKCRKVQHLEKVYSINHELEVLEKMDEEILRHAAEELKVEKTKSSRSSSRQSSSVASSKESASYDPADIPPPSSSGRTSVSSEKSASESVSRTQPSTSRNAQESGSVREKDGSEHSEDDSIAEDIAEDIVDESVGEEDESSNQKSSTPSEPAHSLNETYVVHEVVEELHESPTHSKSVIQNKDSVHSDYEEDFELDDSEQHTSVPEEKTEDLEELETKETISKREISSVKRESIGVKKTKRDKLKDRRIQVSQRKKKATDDGPPCDEEYQQKFPIKGFVIQADRLNQGADSPPKILTVSNPDNCTLLEVKLPKSSTRFVKLHSKNQAGEIKVSYVNPSISKADHEISSSDSGSQKSRVRNEIKLKQKEETEKLIADAVNSSLLKSLFEEQIAKLVAQYRDVNQLSLPSTSGCQCGAYSSQPNIAFTEISKDSKSIQAGDGSLLLSSPKVKLQVDENLLGVESVNRNENVENFNNDVTKTLEEIGQISPSHSSKPCRSLSSVSTNASLHPAELTDSDGHFEQDITLHKFDSDEFIIYPRLHARPMSQSSQGKGEPHEEANISSDNSLPQEMLPPGKVTVDFKVPSLPLVLPKINLLNDDRNLDNSNNDNFVEIRKSFSNIANQSSEIRATEKVEEVIHHDIQPRLAIEPEPPVAGPSGLQSGLSSTAILFHKSEDSDIQGEPSNIPDKNSDPEVECLNIESESPNTQSDFVLPELAEIIEQPTPLTVPNLSMKMDNELLQPPKQTTSKTVSKDCSKASDEDNLPPREEATPIADHSKKDIPVTFSSMDESPNSFLAGQEKSAKSSWPTESITDAIAESLPTKAKRKSKHGSLSSKLFPRHTSLKKRVSNKVWISSREEEDSDSSTSSTWTSTSPSTSDAVDSENTRLEVYSSPSRAALNALGAARLAVSDPILFTHSSSSDSSVDDWQLSAISDDILSDIPNFNQYLRSLSNPSRIKRCSRHKATDSNPNC